MSLGPDARGLLDAAEGGDEPSAADAARVRRKIAAQLAIGAAAGATAATVTKSAGGAAAAGAGTVTASASAGAGVGAGVGAGAAAAVPMTSMLGAKILVAVALVGGATATSAVVMHERAPVAVVVSAATAQPAPPDRRAIPTVAEATAEAPLAAPKAVGSMGTRESVVATTGRADVPAAPADVPAATPSAPPRPLPPSASTSTSTIPESTSAAATPVGKTSGGHAASITSSSVAGKSGTAAGAGGNAGGSAGGAGAGGGGGGSAGGAGGGAGGGGGGGGGGSAGGAGGGAGGAEPAAAPARPAPAPRDTVAEEATLLRAANSALAHGDAATALARIDEHASRFPRGALSEEREAARVLALCAAGRATESRAAATKFVSANPRSPFVAQVRRACTTQ